MLLFALNWLDAQLTIVWVRAGLATEGNALMAYFLDYSALSFLSVKLLIGASVAYLLYRLSHIKLARRGVSLALAVYAIVMLVHLATGIAALENFLPAETLLALLNTPQTLLVLYL